MRVVFDIECNRLKDPDIIWLVVCKDIDTGEYHVFRNVTKDKEVLDHFRLFCSRVSLWVGHHCLGYDLPVLHANCGLEYSTSSVVDTLIISKLVDYSRDGHSIEDYGNEFQFPKGTFSDWSKYSLEMEEYCKRDVDICHKIYLKYLKVIEGKTWQKAIDLEQRFQLVCNELHDNGFAFNTDKARKLLDQVGESLRLLDAEILRAFPPRLKLIREIEPRYTKYGTLNRNDFRWVAGGDLSAFNGGPFCLCRWDTFNPSSHKQLIEVLHAAGWKPTDRTRTHVEYYRSRDRTAEHSPEKDVHLAKYGWKINETNLLSLPAHAPKAARTLASRILYESRRRTLVEWCGLVEEDGRIHGEFQGMGAWTHRMAHQKPNTANIPNELDDQGRIKLLGGDLRQLWCAPKGRLLVGCDAEGIQLRIFAHYIDDPEFTKEVSEGDPHTLNQRVLGSICRDRQAAKRFIYALLLGAGLAKLGEILEASSSDTKDALERIMERYRGFKYLKEHVFPRDVKRGWFQGLDGRKVAIPNVAERPHLLMSGMLQGGEALVIKKAALKALGTLDKDKIKLVDIVHDEFQVEVPNNMEIAIHVGKTFSEAIKWAGEDLNLKCPLSGSFFNKKKNDYTIATNWRYTH